MLGSIEDFLFKENKLELRSRFIDLRGLVLAIKCERS